MPRTKFDVDRELVWSLADDIANSLDRNFLNQGVTVDSIDQAINGLVWAIVMILHQTALNRVSSIEVIIEGLRKADQRLSEFEAGRLEA